MRRTVMLKANCCHQVILTCSAGVSKLDQLMKLSKKKNPCRSGSINHLGKNVYDSSRKTRFLLGKIKFKSKKFGERFI
jgi:hypothetical protein